MLARNQAISAFSEKLRTAVLNGEKVSEFWKAAKLRPERGERAAQQEPIAAADDDAKNKLLDEVDDFVAAVVQEATEKHMNKAKAKAVDAAAVSGGDAKKDQDRERREGAKPSTSDGPVADTAAASPPPKSSGKGSKKPGGGKPAWALSEDQAAAVQEQEEEELLGFAENLDFDTFVGKLDDVELQETFQALKEAEQSQEGKDSEGAWRKSFVRAINQAAFKQIQAGEQANKVDGDDLLSETGRSEGRASITSRARTEATAAKLAAAKGGAIAPSAGKWDSSSRLGDEAKTTDNATSKLRAAEEFLQENPELKAVHSNVSVMTMLAKAEHKLDITPSPAA